MLTIQQNRIIKHFVGFIDQRWYPNFKPTEEISLAFLEYQTHGKKSLTEVQLAQIEPLLNGQKLYEITLKMLVEEMCEWWANDWGWIYPLLSTLSTIKNDNIFKLALLKIKKRCEESGFLEFLKSYTGTSKELKHKYFAKKFGE